MVENKIKTLSDHVLNDTNFLFSDFYLFRSVLGKGSFGIVVEAVSKRTLENMAIKVITSFKFLDNRKSQDS